MASCHPSPTPILSFVADMDAFIERFFAKVYAIADGCWIWRARRNDGGYGEVRVGGRRGRTALAHRAAFELFVGHTPLVLDHTCRNPGCVNPSHLEPVPQCVNALRGSGNGRLDKTTCPYGHPYDAVVTAGIRTQRICRTCRRATNRRYYERRVA